MTPSRHDLTRDRLVDYVLGELSSPVRLEVEQHLHECAACTDELRQLALVSEQLARTVDPAPVPPDLKARVLASLTDIQQEGSVRASLPDAGEPSAWTGTAWALAAAAAVVVTLGGMLYFSNLRARELAAELAVMREHQLDLQRRIDDIAGQGDRVIAILTAADMRPIRLSAPSGQSNAVARAYWSATHGLLLVADDLPEPPPGRIYQVWIIAGDGAAPVSAGLLGEERSRRGMLLVPPPASTGGASDVTVAVTDEPPGGQPAPSGAMRLVGSL